VHRVFLKLIATSNEIVPYFFGLGRIFHKGLVSLIVLLGNSRAQPTSGIFVLAIVAVFREDGVKLSPGITVVSK